MTYIVYNEEGKACPKSYKQIQQIVKSLSLEDAVAFLNIQLENAAPESSKIVLDLRRHIQILKTMPNIKIYTDRKGKEVPRELMYSSASGLLAELEGYSYREILNLLRLQQMHNVPEDSEGYKMILARVEKLRTNHMQQATGALGDVLDMGGYIPAEKGAEEHLSKDEFQENEEGLLVPANVGILVYLNKKGKEVPKEYSMSKDALDLEIEGYSYSEILNLLRLQQVNNIPEDSEGYKIIRAKANALTEGHLKEAREPVVSDDRVGYFHDPVSTAKEYDVIKPDHYKAGGFDVIAFCETHDLGFAVGSAIKYLTRAGKKPNTPELQDLTKAMEFLQRRIDAVKKREKENLLDTLI